MAAAAHSILLIDDDARSREALSQLLNSYGFFTPQAANGQEALDLLHQVQPPSLILLDLRMPVMDGWAFLRQLAQEDELRGVPVVLMTGELFERPVSMPALHKPVQLQRLKPFLQRYCGLK